MYYAVIKPVDVANGPGVRVSLFVSGCRNRCKGCFQPETWAFDYGTEFTEDTMNRIIELLDREYITGFSVLGGDPFEPENQECVLDICRRVKTAYPDKTIWMWTGYLWEDSKHLPVMEYIDVLVDGPFMEELKNISLPYSGSSNQRVIDVKKSAELGAGAIRYRWEE